MVETGTASLEAQAGEGLTSRPGLAPAIASALEQAELLVIATELHGQTLFITMDAPAYLLDQHGRFLMTNPALDRLLGSRPGALTGTQEPERYAPASQDTLTAARAQQDRDGLDYTIAATLLGPDAQPIAC